MEKEKEKEKGILKSYTRKYKVKKKYKLTTLSFLQHNDPYLPFGKEIPPDLFLKNSELHTTLGTIDETFKKGEHGYSISSSMPVSTHLANSTWR